MKLNVFATTTTAVWVVLLTSLASLSSPASASVFNNRLRWPRDVNQPWTYVRVCVEPESSVDQRKRGLEGLIHERQPSLDEVVTKVRQALQGSWELDSSIRFIGWERCNALSAAQRAEYIGLRIHPDAPNNAYIGISGKGQKNAVNIKPWARGGDVTWCIYDTVAPFGQWEYHFECVEEYARHEFGHALGFEHEWRHPLTPQACSSRQSQNEQPVSVSQTSNVFSTSTEFTIVNPTYFDRDSIMTYDTECADVNMNESRFGSPTLTQTDRTGLLAAYPKPLGDWEFCSKSSQCQNWCCSVKYSNDGRLKCTPGQGLRTDFCYENNYTFREWEYCSASQQCANRCCSSRYSNDGRLKCTPLNPVGFRSDICVAPA